MGYKDKDKQREWQKVWIANRRAAWFADKKCEWCGSTADLELDHIDPTTKVAHSIWSWTEKKRDIEAAKCRVLCYECHLKRTAEQRRKPQIHGTMYSYDSCKCRCTLCRKANAEDCKGRRARAKLKVNFDPRQLATD